MKKEPAEKKDINSYIEKAIEKMKFTYPWVKRSMFRKEYTYAIEKENGRDVFVSYFKWSDGDIDREVLDCSEEEFIDRIIDDNESWVEDANEVKNVFKIPFKGGTDAHGWTLERYEFRYHKLGGYSAFVQAGDRVTGGSRVFFIPPKWMDGTFEEFLDKYLELVPGYAFGLFREDLEHVNGLRAFLGFSDKVSKRVFDYIKEKTFCNEYLFPDWEEFLDLLYKENGRVSGILIWDHCLREKQSESLGQGGYLDFENHGYMYAETQIYEDGFEEKSLEEVKQYIRSVQKQYPDHELVPSFYLDE